MMLEAPAGQIDPYIREMIRRWSEPESALDVLQTLDAVVLICPDDSFMVKTLQYMLQTKLKITNQSYDDLIKEAIWRKME